MTTQAGNQRKVREGRVVSEHMNKTVIVAVAHDETNIYHVGDVVRIEETRPLSKTKRWRVVELLVRREVPDVSPDVAAAIVPEATVAPERRRRGPTRASQRAAARRAEEAGTPDSKEATVNPKAKKAGATSESDAEEVSAAGEEAPSAEVETPEVLAEPQEENASTLEVEQETPEEPEENASTPEVEQEAPEEPEEESVPEPETDANEEERKS